MKRFVLAIFSVTIYLVNCDDYKPILVHGYPPIGYPVEYRRFDIYEQQQPQHDIYPSAPPQFQPYSANIGYGYNGPPHSRGMLDYSRPPPQSQSHYPHIPPHGPLSHYPNYGRAYGAPPPDLEEESLTDYGPVGTQEYEHNGHPVTHEQELDVSQGIQEKLDKLDKDKNKDQNKNKDKEEEAYDNDIDDPTDYSIPTVAVYPPYNPESQSSKPDQYQERSKSDYPPVPPQKSQYLSPPNAPQRPVPPPQRPLPPRPSTTPGYSPVLPPPSLPNKHNYPSGPPPRKPNTLDSYYPQKQHQAPPPPPPPKSDYRTFPPKPDYPPPPPQKNYSPLLNDYHPLPGNPSRGSIYPLPRLPPSEKHDYPSRLSSMNSDYPQVQHPSPPLPTKPRDQYIPNYDKPGYVRGLHGFPMLSYLAPPLPYGFPYQLNP